MLIVRINIDCKHMPRSATISSPANPLVKEVRRAMQRSGRTTQGWCVAETFHLLEEALRDADVRHVLASESARGAVEARMKGHAGVPLAVLPDLLFQGIAGTETSQGVLALVKPRVWSLDEMFGDAALIVVLDALQDPGNAGAIVRAGEAFGASGILFLRGTVSPYNPKALRASAGSLFRVPYLASVDPLEACEVFRQRGVALYAAVAKSEGKGTGQESGPTGACGLIIGSEAHGVRPELLAVSTPLTIPTKGVESLNAAVAAGILLYEMARGRSGRG
jgi:RNA methyltransferase, TrmH family